MAATLLLSREDWTLLGDMASELESVKETFFLWLHGFYQESPMNGSPRPATRTRVKARKPQFHGRDQNPAIYYPVFKGHGTGATEPENRRLRCQEAARIEGNGWVSEQASGSLSFLICKTECWKGCSLQSFPTHILEFKKSFCGR